MEFMGKDIKKNNETETKIKMNAQQLFCEVWQIE